MPDVTVPLGNKSSGRFALTAGQVSTVTFVENIGAVEIQSDGSAAVFFTTDGTTPAVDHTNAFPILAGALASTTRDTINTVNGDVVKLISTGTPVVSVTRL